jgi:hypothetical protein
MTQREFYLEQAANCAKAAAATTLNMVRDRQIQAEKAWLTMADSAEQMEQRRAKAALANAARAAAAAESR